MEEKETTYGEIAFGTPAWKLGPVEGFLKRKFPNEDKNIDAFLYNEAPQSSSDRLEFAGFYKGWDGSKSKIQPLKMSDQEAEAYFTKDYNRFKEEQNLNEWTKRQWQLRAGIIK